MFCLLADFWPVSNLSAAQKNPLVFSTVASLLILAISAVVYVIGTSIQPDKTVYMVRGPVAFVCGAFIVLNLFQNSLFAKVTAQPVRGLLLASLCVAWAVVMQLIYESPRTDDFRPAGIRLTHVSTGTVDCQCFARRNLPYHRYLYRSAWALAVTTSREYRRIKIVLQPQNPTD